MSKHTEGPWSISNHSWHETSVFSDVTQQRICHMDTEDWGVDEDTEEEYRKEQEANAHLIAAAPLLLEALHRAGTSSGFQYMTIETREFIEAAITKAEGKPIEEN